MTLTEILPAVRALSKSDKRRLADFLCSELAIEEEELRKIFKPGVVYPVYTPYDEFGAARVLQEMLDRSEAQP